MKKNHITVTLSMLLCSLCSVTYAGNNNNHNDIHFYNPGDYHNPGDHNPGGGCEKPPTPGNPNPCGTLVIRGTGTTKATDFLSHAYMHANQAPANSMYDAFQHVAPFTNRTFTVNTGTLQVGTLGHGYTSAIVTFTYLGASAANTDLFTVGSESFNNKTSSVGSTIAETVNTTGNVLGFSFSDLSNHSYPATVGILDQAGGYLINGLKYADLLLYNDSGSSDRDFNDMVVGVNISCPVPVSPVPEPQTYAMLLGGLALIGFVTLRRKNNFVV